MEIAAAADHGVNVYIFDWYWDDPTEMGMERVARQFIEAYQSPKAESLGESKSHLVYHKSQIVHFDQPGLVLNLLLTISNL